MTPWACRAAIAGLSAALSLAAWAAGPERPAAANKAAAPVFVPDPGPRVDIRCSGIDAVVETSHPETAEVACDGARDAFGFLGWLPRHAGEVVRVELVERLPDGLRPDAVGCYATRSRRLMVLDQALFLQRGTWFGVPVSKRLWRAVVAHEVAHALVGCHLREQTLAVAAHEYVAYVAMFATLDEATRSAVMKAMPGRGFEHPAEINDIRYAFEPMVFGVESYRHWLRQPDGQDFLRSVIRGSIVPDLSR